jgi:hypothetical protein
VPKSFDFVDVDRKRYDRLLMGLQRLRGRIYVEDGALHPEQLTPDGRHTVGIDEHSWHLVSLNENGHVTSCTRYLQHPSTVSFDELRVRTAGQLQPWEWAAHLKGAVESELAMAQKHKLDYIEIGGWAVAEELRGTTEALRSVLTTYAWGCLIGGCLGISTATSRNGSASILRRIGGGPLYYRGEILAPYFDSSYGCEMEVLRFDSRRANPRYQSWVDEITVYLTNIPVICREDASEELSEFSEWVPSKRSTSLVASDNRVPAFA